MAIVAVAAAPVVVAVVVAIAGGWVPIGDRARVALRAEAVLRGDLPLTGIPTTGDLISPSLRADHPGPLLPWLLAVPYRLFGPAGILLTVGAVNVAAIAGAVAAGWRQAGRGLAVAIAALVAVLGWSLGPVILRDPLPTHVTLLPLLAFVLLAWEVRLGRWRSLVGASLAAAWITQAHAAHLIVVLVLALGLGLLVALAPLGGGGRRARRERDRALAWSGGILGVAYLPTLIDQLWGDGNITRLGEVAGSAGLGIGRGVQMAVRALGFRPAFLRTGSGPLLVLERPDLVDGIVALATVSLLGWLLLDARRRGDLVSRSLLEMAALGLLALALVGARVPQGGAVLAADALFLAWPLTALTWLAIGRAAASRWLVGRVRPARDVEERALAAVGIGAAGLLILVAASAPPRFVGSGEGLVDPLASIADEVRSATAGQGLVAVHANGSASARYARPAVMAMLERNGSEAVTDDADMAAIRLDRTAADADADLWLVSGPSTRVQPEAGARLVAQVDLVEGGTSSPVTSARRTVRDAIAVAGVTIHDGPHVTTDDVRREYFRLEGVPGSSELALPADLVSTEEFVDLWSAGMVVAPEIPASVVRQVRRDQLGREGATGDLVLSVWYRPRS